MEKEPIVQPQKEDEGLQEEEYVLLDLQSISDRIAIPPAAPYLLSGLETANPILVIDNKLKLIGEYEETIGTCLVFSENDGINPVVHEDAARQTPSSSKQINPMAKLHKILKFRPYLETGEEEAS